MFTLVPLLVFVFQSLRSQSKMNWTGPVWLAAIPAMVSSMATAPLPTRAGRLLERAWTPAILVLIVLYGAFLQLPVLGLPGLRLPVSEYGMSWRSLGRRVSEIRNDVASIPCARYRRR